MLPPSSDGGAWEVQPASRIPAETVRWVWPGRIPAGKLTVIEGDPATAKSTLTLDLAARVTRGAEWPDGQPATPPSSVLLLSAEDGWGDTIRPRLEAARADLDRCWCVNARRIDTDEGIMHRPVVLPEDIGWIARLVERSGAVLVIIDVLAAYLSDRVDAHKDQSVRRLLHHLAGAASRTGAAVVMVRHHNKLNGGPAMYRGGGSVGIIGAARAGYAVIRDPDDAEHRLLATVKSNLAVEAPTWGYRLEEVPNLGVARVRWDERADDRRIAELLGTPPADGSLHEAVDWLQEWRSQHPGAQPAAALRADAEAAGISHSTLDRARRRLGIRAHKSSNGWQVE